ncbi:MAG: hypothetical protein K2L17_12375 [Muribaculaceae bacterium]|nr:hypothetical protein [Muribaculaceae bacterium]
MVTKLLERAIEIEGLLRIIRDGNPLPETYTLLSNKAVELADEAMLLEESAPAKNQETESKQMTESKPGIDNDSSDTNFNVEKIEELTPPAIVMIEDGEPATIDSATPENEELHDDLSETETEEGFADFPELTTSVASKTVINTPAHYSDNEEYEDDILLTFDEDDEKPEPEETIEESVIEIKEEEPKEVAIENDIEIIHDDNEKKSTKKPSKLKSAFSLNDRFLYAREIFDGKMKMFDSTLEFIGDIDNFSVIEDFFYNEMELDPENPSVISFMEILKPHFVND